MITREEALKFLDKQIANKNIIKHLLATEAVMKALSQRFDPKNEIAWTLAGLLHDGDYTPDVPENEQGIKVAQLLREEGFELTEEIKHAMAAHNPDTGVTPETKMAWSLFCCDSLTGLIVATALVRPEKKLANVEAKSVLKKFKDKGFARGTRREDIALCESKLGIPLQEFVEINLQAMKGIAKEMGL